MSETAPTDFADLLEMPAENAVRPPTRPGGTYRATFKSATDTISSKKRTKGLTFTFGDLEPLADVDSAAYEAYVDSPVIDPRTDTMSEDFWVTPKSVYRIKEFCIACGVSEKDRLLSKQIADSIGARVLITVQQNVADSGNTYAIITGYAADE